MCTADAQDLLKDPSFTVAVKAMLANITSLPMAQVQLSLFIGTSLCGSSHTRSLSPGSLRGLQSLTSTLEGEYICSFLPSSSGEESSDTKAQAAMEILSSKSESELTLLLRQTAQLHASLNSARLPTVSAGPPTLTVQQLVTSTPSAPVASVPVIQIVAIISIAVLLCCCMVFLLWRFYRERTVLQSMPGMTGKDEKQKSLEDLKQVSPEPEPKLQDGREEEEEASLRMSAEVKNSKQNDNFELDLNRPSKLWPPVPPPKLVPVPSDNPPDMVVYDLPIKVRSSEKGDTYVSTKVVMSGRPDSAPASRASHSRLSYGMDKRPHSAVGANLHARNSRRSFKFDKRHHSAVGANLHAFES